MWRVIQNKKLMLIATKNWHVTFYQPGFDWNKWRVWRAQLLFMIWLVFNTLPVATICSSLSGKWSSTLLNAVRPSFSPAAPPSPDSPQLGLDLRLPGAQQQDVGGPKRWPNGKITSDKIWESCHVKIPNCHAVKNVHFKPGNTTWLANQKDWPKIMSMYKSVDIHESSWKMRNKLEEPRGPVQKKHTELYARPPDSNRPRALPWVVVFQSALQSPNPSRAGRGFVKWISSNPFLVKNHQPDRTVKLRFHEPWRIIS